MFLLTCKKEMINVAPQAFVYPEAALFGALVMDKYPNKIARSSILKEKDKKSKSIIQIEKPKPNQTLIIKKKEDKMR